MTPRQTVFARAAVLALDKGPQWVEDDHPRSADGRFGAGGAPGPAAAKPAEKAAAKSDADIGRDLETKLTHHFGESVAEYDDLDESAGGKILNTDTARELSSDYLADRTKSAAVHEAASAFIKRLYAQKLAEPPRPGELPMVLFTAGGTGAGKSSALKGVPGMTNLSHQAQVIYDTNMNKIASAREKIDQALAAGKSVTIAMVVRDPEDALVNGALPRAENQRKKFGTGRTVPLHEHIRTHTGAMETVKQLADDYAGNPDVVIKIVDNSLGKGNQQERDIDWLRTQEYNDVEQRVRAALEREHEAGRISSETYRGFASGGQAGGKPREVDPAEPGSPGGDRAVQRRDRPGAGRQPQASDDAGEVAERQAAGVILMAPDGRALFLRRGAGGDHAGEWALPGGGIEPGELAEDAVKRECMEEIGALPYGDRQVLDASDNGEGVHYTTFHQPITHAFTPRLNHEHTEHIWAGLGALPQPLHPNVAAVLQRVVSRGTRIAPSAALAQDEDHWITVNGGNGVGTPLLITGGGVVVGGAGGNMNGKTLNPSSKSAPVTQKGGSEGGASKSADVAKALQNRNRSSAASVSQMNKIAAKPNPRLLMASPTMADGAPVVSDLAGHGVAKATGKRDWVVTSKREIPVRYAVVEASALSASNRADGTKNDDYAKDPSKLVAINNGRTAGLQEAYARGTAADYKTALAKAERIHGIPAKTIKGMQSPVLVRIMDAKDVDEHIGDESNSGMTLSLSAVEQAQNDAARFDPAAIDYNDDGTPTDASVRGFINAMPQAEQQSLSPNGRPTKQAIERMTAATFHAAYGDSELVNLAAQATDPESRNLISGLSRAAGAMAKLKDAGELDIRELVTGAAKQIINAVRSGVSIKKFLKQGDLLTNSAEDAIAGLMAENARSAKALGEKLAAAADFAFRESQKGGVDMFGETIPTASRSEVLETMHA